jgi:hypothetical protein
MCSLKSAMSAVVSLYCSDYCSVFTQQIFWLMLPVQFLAACVVRRDRAPFFIVLVIKQIESSIWKYFVDAAWCVLMILHPASDKLDEKSLALSLQRNSPGPGVFFNDL